MNDVQEIRPPGTYVLVSFGRTGRKIARIQRYSRTGRPVVIKWSAAGYKWSGEITIHEREIVGTMHDASPRLRRKWRTASARYAAEQRAKREAENRPCPECTGRGPGYCPVCKKTITGEPTP